MYSQHQGGNENQITTNASEISSTETVVSLHTKSILVSSSVRRRFEVPLGGAGFRKSLLHCATGLVSRIHII